jgi:hypothetical protein
MSRPVKAHEAQIRLQPAIQSFSDRYLPCSLPGPWLCSLALLSNAPCSRLRRRWRFAAPGGRLAGREQRLAAARPDPPAPARL